MKTIIKKPRNVYGSCIQAGAVLLAFCPLVRGGDNIGNMNIGYRADPITRYVHVDYQVPANAGQTIEVFCEVRKTGDFEWQPAAIWPWRSETALNLMSDDAWDQGLLHGKVTERRAAGLPRRLVWNPFPVVSGCGDVEFRITLKENGNRIAQNAKKIELKNDDVVILDDWRDVLQKQFVSENPQPGQVVWWFHTAQQGEYAPQGGSMLTVKEKNVELPQLTYPLNLKGPYAVFVASGTIELRFSGEELFQQINRPRPGAECFWQWQNLDRQHLIIKQPFDTVPAYYENDKNAASLDYVRLVPLTDELVEQVKEQWRPRGDKRLVIGYNEPYSWAFHRKIENMLDHLEPPLRFAQANVDVMDVQIGRPGALMVFETRTAEQLLFETVGDPAASGKIPHTNNVGRMQMYTNMLESQLRYARQFGVKLHANIGATICYAGQPLESQFSKDHPQWRRSNCLIYDVPEVRQYILGILDEALQIGAEGISIDWTRYPNSIENAETINVFFRELRALTDAYSQKRGTHVDVLVRFAVPDSFWVDGEDRTALMDYRTWVREGLVDILCPSYYDDQTLHFPLEEYLQAIKGTPVKLVPCVGYVELPMPGMWLNRVRDCYQQGVHGIYVYQLESLVCNNPHLRRWIAMAGSADSVQQWADRERANQPSYSKGIYITRPSRNNRFRSRERLRAWVEGVSGSELELYIDGQLINRYEKPPYVLTSEAHKDDHTIPPGPHRLKARARDGDDWLEQEFNVVYDVK